MSVSQCKGVVCVSVGVAECASASREYDISLDIVLHAQMQKLDAESLGRGQNNVGEANDDDDDDVHVFMSPTLQESQFSNEDLFKVLTTRSVDHWLVF